MSRLEDAHDRPVLIQRSLDHKLRLALELSLDADLSALRIYDGPLADRLTRNLGAKAVTLGSNVYFRRGAYSSHTLSGRWLLAHEAVHVAQQASDVNNAGADRAFLSRESDVWEQEADRFATAFVSGALSPAPRD